MSPHSSPLILSLGSINADFQMRTDRRPHPDETLLARDFVRLGGGKAANVAFLAARLGHEVRLIGRVGRDSLAEQALAPLRQAGLDIGHVRSTAGVGTAVSIITVPPDGRKGIVLAPRANDAWCREDVPWIEEVVGAAPSGSTLVADCEVPPFVVEAAMREARRGGSRTLLDPSPAERVHDDLLQLADVILPNAGEAEALTGIAVADFRSAARAGGVLLERGCRTACVRLPRGGCLVAEGSRRWQVIAPELEVVDTTGAGDAFAGSMAVALTEGADAVEAAAFAAAAATHAVTGYGSQPAYPDRAEIEAHRTHVETQGLR